MNAETLKREYSKIKTSLSCRVTEDDYKNLETRIPYVLELAELQNQSISLYDLNKHMFILKVDKHLELLGYSVTDTIDIADVDKYHSLIHPADLSFMYDSEIRMFNYLKPIKNAEKKDYKLVYDYRVRRADGTYLRFLHQLALFELDQDFNSWILLVISDVISSVPYDELPRRFLLNTKTKKVCLFNEEIGVKSEILTKREREILELLSRGFESKEISDKLCVCVSTINNHRQNILRKTRAKTIEQAAAYTKSVGLI